jgi:GTP-binding protein
LSNLFRDIHFVLSATALAQLPPDAGIEVAFVGRSNAGKSSAINAITARKGLARTSKTPGRTTAINVFAVDERRRLLDLPGFGYARVPESVSRRWMQLVSQYLQSRRSLAGLILLIDVRRLPGAQENALLAWCRDNAIPTHVLLAKSDKLGRGSNAEALRRLQTELLAYGPQVTAQLFSALRREGLAQARGILVDWLRMVPDGQKKAPANKGREPGA